MLRRFRCAGAPATPMFHCVRRPALKRPERFGGAAGIARPVVFAAMAALVLCGCSTFERDWKRRAAQPAPRDSIEGAWSGRWVSDASGHSDRLRCLVSRLDETHYAARFRASYASVFRFTYTVRLEAQPHYGGWEFSGQEDLGALAGGVYYYEGHATPTNFFSTYRSQRDRGIFEMRRPD